MKFAGRLLAKSIGGNVRTADGVLFVEGADEAVLLFTATTDYSVERMNYDRSIDPGQKATAILNRAASKTWEDIVKDHTAEHQGLFHRVSLDLGGEDRSDVPTDKRLAAIRQGGVDPQLVAQYFQFGRYLLMSSSRRPGRLPANLQGMWNDQMWAPWEADYHLNINLQMNYWPAEVCNLPETIDPLVDWFIPRPNGAAFRPGGFTTPRLGGVHELQCLSAYDAQRVDEGFAIPERRAGSVGRRLDGDDALAALRVHKGQEVLTEKAYPVLKGAAQFLLDYLVESADGMLVIVPSTSPENAYFHPETGQPVRLTVGSTYHTTLVQVVFDATIQAAKTLDTDEGFRKELTRPWRSCRRYVSARTARSRSGLRITRNRTHDTATSPTCWDSIRSH